MVLGEKGLGLGMGGLGEGGNCQVDIQLVYYFQVQRQIMRCTALLDIHQCSTLHCIIGL